VETVKFTYLLTYLLNLITYLSSVAQFITFM